MLLHLYLVPYWIDDSDVALHCSGKNSVGWCHLKRPENDSCEPDAAIELVAGAGGWHATAVHLDNCCQQREERRTRVRDALIDYQNVYRLNKYSDTEPTWFRASSVTRDYYDDERLNIIK